MCETACLPLYQQKVTTFNSSSAPATNTTGDSHASTIKPSLKDGSHPSSTIHMWRTRLIYLPAPSGTSAYMLRHPSYHHAT